MPLQVSVDIGGYTTVVVEDYNSEFHQLKHKETKSWVNCGRFIQGVEGEGAGRGIPGDLYRQDGLRCGLLSRRLRVH